MNAVLILLKVMPLDDMNPYAITGRSLFGMRVHPTLKVKKMHWGIDDPEAKDTPAKSVDDNGKVVVSKMQGNGKGYGNYVVIKYSWGYVIYCHLNKRTVKVGDHVKAGQIIGYVGTTGESSGPHLHFGMCKNWPAKNDNLRGWFDPVPSLKVLYDKLNPKALLISVNVDGNIAKMNAVFRDGYYYAKLRDLAAAMPEKVVLGYSKATGPTVNGKKFNDAKTIIVDGFSYVLFRSAADVIGTFEVGYDKANNMPTITSKA